MNDSRSAGVLAAMLSNSLLAACDVRFDVHAGPILANPSRLATVTACDPFSP